MAIAVRQSVFHLVSRSLLSTASQLSAFRSGQGRHNDTGRYWLKCFAKDLTPPTVAVTWRHPRIAFKSSRGLICGLKPTFFSWRRNISSTSAAGDLPCRYSPLQKKSPKRGGGEMRLGLTRGRGREGESSPDSTGRGHFGLADHRSASITETPHSPQLKVPRSGRPPVPSVMRARCIDLPQFGQAGRTVT